MSEADYKKVPIQESTGHEKKDEEPAKYGYGVRHVQALLFFVCISTGFIARAHLGVTIVAMTVVKHSASEVGVEPTGEANVLTNRTKIEIHNEDIHENVSAYTENINASSSWNGHETYDWPKSVQEMALGSFFLGYSIMMFPIGLVCQRWGGKIPLQIAMFVNGVVSISTPWMIRWAGWKALCACRILQGLSQAGLFPGTISLVTNWVPVYERGTLFSYIFTGSGMGAVLGFQLGGLLAFSRFGWPSTFWVSGIACFVTFLLISCFVAKSPTEHKFISKAETDYIVGTIGATVKTEPKVPWVSIFRSVHAWATFIAQAGCVTNYLFFFVQVPTYMSAILKVDIKNNGLLSSLPYLASIVCSIAFGYLSDFCTNRKIVSIKNGRRISNSIATMVPALVLFAVSYTTSTALAVTCFVLAVAASAAFHTGGMINYMDVSPRYSGALMATGGTVTNAVLVSLPLLVSNVVTDVTNQYQWRTTMFLMGAFTIATNVFFVIFMTDEIQPWNDPDNKPKNTKQSRLN